MQVFLLERSWLLNEPQILEASGFVYVIVSTGEWNPKYTSRFFYATYTPALDRLCHCR